MTDKENDDIPLPDEITKHMRTMAQCGLAIVHPATKARSEAYSLTEAGMDYVKSVMLAHVTDREKIYALGRLQGLRETEVKS